jgi:hypothetical protein
MNYSLGNMLGRRMALASLDPNAKGYIDAVVAAGGTVSGAQKAIINTFYETGKSDGWYSSLKRLYLPIWGVAAPNAICMTSLASGTFVGTVTHAAGYAQGDGTTGYLNTNTDFVTQGLSESNGLLFALTNQDATVDLDAYIGAGSGALGETVLRHRTTPSIQALFVGNTNPLTLTTVSNTGVVAFSRNAGSRRLSLRKTAGITDTSAVIGDIGTIRGSNVLAMAQNNANSGVTLANASNARFGAVGFGLGLSSAATDNFTLALKNLWEGITGLTLP